MTKENEKIIQKIIDGEKIINEEGNNKRKKVTNPKKGTAKKNLLKSRNWFVYTMIVLGAMIVLFAVFCKMNDIVLPAQKIDSPVVVPSVSDVFITPEISAIQFDVVSKRMEQEKLRSKINHIISLIKKCQDDIQKWSKNVQAGWTFLKTDSSPQVELEDSGRIISREAYQYLICETCADIDMLQVRILTYREKISEISLQI